MGKIILKVLMGQRKERYEGEYGPEALEVMTEFDYAENDSWLLDKFDEHAKEKHWESLSIIDVEVNAEDLMKILRPSTKIEGKIKS